MSTAQSPFDVTQVREDAMLRAGGRAAVLERLFELFEASHHAVDFAGQREEEFWLGLRQIATGISEDLAALKDAETEAGARSSGPAVGDSVPQHAAPVARLRGMLRTVPAILDICREEDIEAALGHVHAYLE